MTDTRKAKIDGIANHIPRAGGVVGRDRRQARRRRLGLDLRADPAGGAACARPRRRREPHPHPSSVAAAAAISRALLRSYERVLVPEMNTGQLKTILRDQYLVDAKPLNKVSGQPFMIAEIEAAIDQALA